MANESTGCGTATSALMYRAVSVQFDASHEALWWAENVNFMPYRL